MSSGYREVARRELVDPEGNVLAIVIESNTVSFKMFAEYRTPDQTSSEAAHSGWWSFMKLDRAKEQMSEKVEEAKALGWEEASAEEDQSEDQDAPGGPADESGPPSDPGGDGA